MKLWYWFSWYMLQIVAKIFFRLSVTGWEQVPQKGAVVLACNHASYLDPPFVALTLHRQIYYLARQSLFSNRVFGALIRGYGAHPVSRSSAKGIKTALQILKEEKALLVFPEGTRTLDGKLQTVKTGAAWLAVHAGCPIVPVYIHGSYQAFPKGKAFPTPHKVHVVIGAPMDPAQFNGDRETRIQCITRSLQNVLQKHEQQFLQS